MYDKIKKRIPSPLRSLLKPWYQSWHFRTFIGRQLVPIYNDEVQFFLELDRKNGAVDEYIFIHRNWELQVGQVLHEQLQPGGVFVDVGANIGYFSLLAATLVGESGRVIAFEPLPRLVGQIRRSAVHNHYQWLKVVPKALGDVAGSMELVLSAHNIGGSSLVTPNRIGERVTVEVSTLDFELADLERIDVIKIDVEGFEYEMLQGAQQTLERCRPTLVLEFSPHFYKERSTTMETEILTLLRQLGYTFTILQTGKTADDIDTLLTLIKGEQVDLLCTITKEEKEQADEQEHKS